MIKMTRAVVVDSSVIVKWLNQDQEDYLEQADQLLGDVHKGNVELLAPELAKYEVANVLLLGKHITVDQIEVLINKLYLLPITFIPETEWLAQETYQLAGKLQITYYDAAFLSLAVVYQASVVTDNVKHQGKASHITVIPIADY